MKKIFVFVSFIAISIFLIIVFFLQDDQVIKKEGSVTPKVVLKQKEISVASIPKQKKGKNKGVVQIDSYLKKHQQVAGPLQIKEKKDPKVIREGELVEEKEYESEDKNRFNKVLIKKTQYRYPYIIIKEEWSKKGPNVENQVKEKVATDYFIAHHILLMKKRSVSIEMLEEKMKDINYNITLVNEGFHLYKVDLKEISIDSYQNTLEFLTDNLKDVGIVFSDRLNTK